MPLRRRQASDASTVLANTTHCDWVSSWLHANNRHNHISSKPAQARRLKPSVAANGGT